jgi:hypothetical protein
MQQHIAFILNLESRGTKRALFSRARLPPRNDAVTSRSVGEALGQRFEDNWALNGQDQETRITLPHPFDACRAWELLLSSHYSHQPLSGVENVMTSKLLNALCSDGKNRIGC